MKNVIVLNIQFEYDGICHEIHPVILRNEVETYICYHGGILKK